MNNTNLNPGSIHGLRGPVWQSDIKGKNIQEIWSVSSYSCWSRMSANSESMGQREWAVSCTGGETGRKRGADGALASCCLLATFPSCVCLAQSLAPVELWQSELLLLFHICLWLSVNVFQQINRRRAGLVLATLSKTLIYHCLCELRKRLIITQKQHLLVCLITDFRKDRKSMLHKRKAFSCQFFCGVIVRQVRKALAGILNQMANSKKWFRQWGEFLTLETPSAHLTLGTG